ncbi:MAG: hypothetical protein JSU92_05790 [Deltaproteobacteria bacterium]|nr:MAG: hypothetical protein JSU92_05790 [Deltaproteobacteria bacterium]
MKKASILATTLTVCGILAAGTAYGDLEFKMPTEYRFRANWLSDFPVDDEGRELGQNSWLENRLRVSPELWIGEKLKLLSQADFFSGLISGDEADLGTDFADRPWDGEDDFEYVEPRQLWVEWESPVGVLRLGQMASHWGLGLVSNDGENRLNEFGESYYGDLYWRALFGTKPLKFFSDSDLADRLVLGVGYDIVWRDENASFEDGDRGSEFVLSCFYDDPDHIFAGVYLALRDQEDDDGDEVKATAYDIYLSWKSGSDEEGGLVLSAAFEGAMIRGWTDRVLYLGAIENAPRELDLESFGMALRTGVSLSGLRLGLEGGYASGDANTYDDTNYAFSFDPDYNVGVVLFDEVIASLSAAQPDSIADPELVYIPQKGIDQLPTDGSVTNAFYQSVFVSYRPPEKEGGLGLKLGLLHAWAAEDFMDPFQTAANAGGVPTNFKGAECGNKELGWEFDTEMSYQHKLSSVELLGSVLMLRGGLQYGHFMPGNAFADEQGNQGKSIRKLQGRITIEW